MKTQLLTIPCLRQSGLRAGLRLLASGLSSRVVSTLGASAVLAGLPIAATWAAGQGWPEAVAASSWMAGIVFLALAVDNDGWRSALQAGTGLLLMLLAWWSTTLAPELGVLAAFLVAIWLAIDIFESRV